MKYFSRNSIGKAAVIMKCVEAMGKAFTDTGTRVVGLVIQGFHDV